MAQASAGITSGLVSLRNALGTPNWCEPGRVCFHPRVNNCIQTMGDPPVRTHWRHAAGDGHVLGTIRPFAPTARRASTCARYAKPRCITIDPRETVVAKKSRSGRSSPPGTDDALGSRS
jgi:hypothetical protein